MDHEILLKRLNLTFGMSGTKHKLFKSNNIYTFLMYYSLDLFLNFNIFIIVLGVMHCVDNLVGGHKLMVL